MDNYRNMLKPFNSYARKNPFGTSTINRNSLPNTDITGSLQGIEEPTKYTRSQYRNKSLQSKVTNLNSLPISDITGSLQNIEQPTKYTKSQYRNNTIGVKTINEKTKSLSYKKQIIEFSAKQIEKQITSFDAGQNKLYISASSLDYDGEQITNENFELFYNGASVPFLYSVEQINNDVVVTFSENYIDYGSLQNSQVFVIGKFKE